MTQLFRCLAVLVTLGTAAAAQADVRKRVTLALGQPALVEQMGASACFALGGIDAARQADTLREAMDLFRTTLGGFAEGHEWMGLAPATDPQDLARIAQALDHWTAYEPALRQFLAGDLHSVVISQLLAGTEPAAAQAQDLARHFMTAPIGIAPERAQALLLAARQRVLTQRALRQTCLIHVGLAGPSMRVALTDTLARIRTGAGRLSTGGGDVSPPPDARIARNLRTADLFWSKMRPALDLVASGARASDAEIAKALKLNKSVQKQLVQAIDGYAGSGM